MNIMDKFKKLINVTDDDFDGTADEGYEDDFDFAPGQSQPQPQAQPQSQKSGHSKAEKAAASNVVNFNSGKTAPASAKPHVVFQKIDRFEEVGEVADILNDKRIVILNLETCPNDVSQRIIDFLYGVAYANHGDFKKIAGRAYIITPYNVPVSGELVDEISGAMYEEEE